MKKIQAGEYQMYKIAVCDDELFELNAVSTIVEQWSARTGKKINMETFPSAESFLFHYAEHKDYDILLLDVEMKELSGIELAKQIRKDNKHVEMVFITSHFEFAGEGYEVDALHYLVKPVKEEKLFEVLDKAVKKLSEEPENLVISCDGEIIRLFEDDILYAESFLHYISIYTDRQEYKIKKNLSEFEKEVSESFFRIHRSYLVNLKAVTRISRTGVLLNGTIELPLARGKYDAINQAYIRIM